MKTLVFLLIGVCATAQPPAAAIKSVPTEVPPDKQKAFGQAVMTLLAAQRDARTLEVQAMKAVQDAQAAGKNEKDEIAKYQAFVAKMKKEMGLPDNCEPQTDMTIKCLAKEGK